MFFPKCTEGGPPVWEIFLKNIELFWTASLNQVLCPEKLVINQSSENSSDKFSDEFGKSLFTILVTVISRLNKPMVH